MKKFLGILTEIVNELSELVAASEKLIIRVISIVGWILILWKLFQ